MSAERDPLDIIAAMLYGTDFDETVATAASYSADELFEKLVINPSADEIINIVYNMGSTDEVSKYWIWLKDEIDRGITKYNFIIMAMYLKVKVMKRGSPKKLKYFCGYMCHEFRYILSSFYIYVENQIITMPPLANDDTALDMAPHIVLHSQHKLAANRYTAMYASAVPPLTSYSWF